METGNQTSVPCTTQQEEPVFVMAKDLLAGPIHLNESH